MTSKNSSAIGKLSPLGLIAAFLTFTEVVIGIVVTQASGGVQVALTSFVISFPLLVATAFFYILWHRPYVLYPPGEYAGVDVSRFVEAMQRRQSDEKETLKLVRSTLESTAETPETKQFANAALKRVEDQILDIELFAITKDKKTSYVTLFQAERPVYEFLDDMWFVLSEHIPPYTFGTVWGLRDKKTGKIFSDMGRKWAQRHLKTEDDRSLKAVGFYPGMKLEAILLANAG